MTTRTAELLMAIAMLLMSLGIIWSILGGGLRIGWVEETETFGAGMWPFWLSVGMVLSSLWILVRWFQGTTPESRSDAPYVDPDTMMLVVTSFVSLTVMVILISVVGTYIAVALFLGFYMRVVGKHSWGAVIGGSLGMVVFIYFLFEWQLSKYLPKGWPIFENGFLWIDNFRWTYLM